MMPWAIIGSWSIPLRSLELASPFIGSRYNHLEHTTKLALANVPDVDDVVSRILQQLQPKQDHEAGGDDDHDAESDLMLSF